MTSISKPILYLLMLPAIIITLSGCSTSKSMTTGSNRVPVIFDTDANNELDDQHALAYLFCNGNSFDVKAVTVNATFNGGNIQGHYDEAERIMTLCNLNGKIPLLKGANANYNDIKSMIKLPNYDGSEAVDFIIAEAHKARKEPLVLIAVGKLTNVALALEKDPTISSKLRVVWLGANYPEPGEYNLINDIPSMNYVLNSDVPLEIVMVRYGKDSGTDAVRVSQVEVNTKMVNLGPKAKTSITGRHGGTYDNFGDYASSLFEHIDLHGDPPSRALFDMAAVAIVKNPTWAKASTMPAPIMIDEEWKDRPDNNRKIIVWEYFDRDGIIDDFYKSLTDYTLIYK